MLCETSRVLTRYFLFCCGSLVDLAKSYAIITSIFNSWFSNYVMTEMPAKLASHPRLGDAPELALQETFEEVDRTLGEISKENEQLYRRVLRDTLVIFYVPNAVA